MEQRRRRLDRVGVPAGEQHPEAEQPQAAADLESDAAVAAGDERGAWSGEAFHSVKRIPVSRAVRAWVEGWVGFPGMSRAGACGLRVRTTAAPRVAWWRSGDEIATADPSRPGSEGGAPLARDGLALHCVL